MSTYQSISTFKSRLTRGIGALSILMLAIAGILALLKSLAIVEINTEVVSNTLVFFSINSLLTVILSFLILARHPDHGVGQLFLAIGFLFSFWVFSFTVNGLFEAENIELPGLIRPFVDIGLNIYIVPLMMSFGLVPLYFPDGRLLSPRWRPILVVVWVGIIGLQLSYILLDSSFSWFENLITIIFLAGMLGSMASLILRFNRSKGDERVRMKWLVYTAVLAVSMSLLMVVFLGTGNRFLSFFGSNVPSLLAISIGIAILRHKLWDIDLIIRRTLQYAILMVVLGLIYFGGIVLLQNVFGGLFGDNESPLITVISTLTIAALFNPLRGRVQNFIDQRFFRSKYDAEKALIEFAAVARDEVDMVRLSGSLLSVVENTMQPEQTSLWLRETVKGE